MSGKVKKTREELATALHEANTRLAELEAKEAMRRCTDQVEKVGEDRLLRMLDATSDGVWDHNLETGEMYVSSDWARMLGYDAKEIESDSLLWKEFMHPDDYEAFSDLLKAHYDGETPLFRAVSRMRHKSGAWLHVLCRGKIVEWDALKQPRRIVGTIMDFTEKKRTEQELIKTERDYRSIFESAVEGIFQTAPEGRYLKVNPALVRIYGFDSPEEMLAHFSDISNQLYVDATRRKDFVRVLTEHDEIMNFESQVYRKDGSIIWISENARVVHGSAGEPSYYEGTVIDITQRKNDEAAIEEQRVFFRQLFENSPMAIVLMDENGVILDINSGFEDLFGYTHEECIGRKNRELIVPPEMLPEFETLSSIVGRGKSINMESERVHKNGRRLPVSVLGYPVRVKDEVKGIFFSYRDISERRAYEDQLTHQAFHDALTGLPNRSLFLERLNRAIQRSQRSDTSNFAVLMVDLDRFKHVNDSLGHNAGDTLLVHIAKRFSRCVRSVDTVARLGGDEFAIIVEDVRKPREVVQVAARIMSELEKPFQLDEHEIITGASIGIVLKTKDYTQAASILRDADIAMYRAKEVGESSFRVFNKEMYQLAIENMSLETDLRHALPGGQLKLFYQPILAINTTTLVGFEALLRWEHPVHGLVSPDKFIPIAEETGMIVPIGEWVLETACRQLKTWQTTLPGAENLTVSVNISGKQLMLSNLPKVVGRILKQSEVKASHLKLEITESVAMQDVTLTIEILHRLKKLGIKVMIDDFGTGYSSLSYLQQFPIDYLKIDRSFISAPHGTEQNEYAGGENIEIVKTIVALARTLGMHVVAEGVEEEAQLTQLKDVQCDEAQGFFFSKPVDYERAEQLINELGCV